MKNLDTDSYGVAQSETNKIHSVDWHKFVVEKKDGGLGVATLKAQNLALLIKWW